MKLSLLSILCLLTVFLQAQTSCETAKPFCAGGVSGVTFPATTSVTTAQTGPAYGCLGSTPNPSWYYLQISQSGNLDILIQGQIPPSTPGQDVDFICWGPFSSLTGICNSLTATNIVDCSYSGSFTETLNIPTGIVGEYYMVLITNFANIQQDIIFSQYAGTGATNCGLVSSNSKICAGSVATVVATNSGSLTNPSYSLNPGGLTNTTGTFFVTPLLTTNYTLFVTGFNNLNVLTTQTAVSTVTVNSQPSAAPSVTNTTCTSNLNAFNLNVAFSPTTTVPGYTISYAPTPNGITSTIQQTLTGGINAAAYNVTITAAGGCSTTAEFTINAQPEPAVITLDPPGFSHTITCLQPVITLNSLVTTNSYTWSNGLNAPFTGPTGVFTNTMLGTWTINAINPSSSCISSRTVSIFQNVLTPTTTVGPNFQNITCSLTSITTVSATASPSVNITHLIMSPLGGTVSAASYTTIYLPPAPGVYTHCAVNEANGCSTCKNFTVSSNQGFPVFNLTSPQNFSLGCNTKSVATINIVNAVATNSNQVPTGGPVSYTLLSPTSASSIPNGTLSSLSSYTVNSPGTWTVVTKDNTSFCETRLPISILQNTFTPEISAVVPQQTLDCSTRKVVLKGQSTTPNISYLWSFPATPGNQPGDSITANIIPNAITTTLVANYTLTITDNNNTCKSTSIIPIYQNIYKPNSIISNGGTPSITCITTTITLTNQSTSNIPPAIFPITYPVIGLLWEGPTPQDPLQNSTTYIGQYPGVYTLTAKDMNNGCTNTGTINIIDNRVYPNVVTPNPLPTLDCGANSKRIGMTISNKLPVFTYTWQPPAGAIVSDRFKDSLETNAVGFYKLLVRNSVNGCASSSEVTVLNGSLTAKITPNLQSGFAPLAVTFSNSSSSTLDNSRIVSNWSFGNGTFTSVPSASYAPQVTYRGPGIYTVTLFATKGTCTAVATQTISVDLPSALIIPNVFTPNGDKINDEFFLTANNLTEINFTIFDRWGNQVFEVIAAAGNVVWDGKNQAGQELSEGVYYYVMKAKGSDLQEFERNGTISLIR